MQSDNDTIKQQVRLVSHEIRNQLSISDVYCEIIKKQLAKNNIENESIDKALQCIGRSTKLIGNALLDLKTITNIELQQISVNQLIEESIELGKTYFYDKSIEIISKLGKDTEILADKNKLQACIINIIKNASEAIAEKGFIEISTSFDNNNFKISIKNNGKPITKTERTKIFNDGHTTKSQGSGIGLYLSRENLRKMGGDLTLKDTKITEFEISLKI